MPSGLLRSRSRGRVSPSDQHVDGALGGSTKAVRPRPPCSFDDGDRIITTAAVGEGLPGVRLRDVGLAALHLRTGLKPKWIAALRWDEVTEFTAPAGNEVESIWLETDRGPKLIVFHGTAIKALSELWVAEGRPATGPVFVRSRRPRTALTDRGITEVLARSVERAGFPPLDRRHMRAPFARWLLVVQGWDELRVRDAMGYERVRDLRNLVRGLEEAAAQIRGTDALILSPEPAERARWLITPPVPNGAVVGQLRLS